jgi:hypothetical protein
MITTSFVTALQGIGLGTASTPRAKTIHPNAHKREIASASHAQRRLEAICEARGAKSNIEPWRSRIYCKGTPKRNERLRSKLSIALSLLIDCFVKSVEHASTRSSSAAMIVMHHIIAEPSIPLPDSPTLSAITCDLRGLSVSAERQMEIVPYMNVGLYT